MRNERVIIACFVSIMMKTYTTRNYRRDVSIIGGLITV